MGRMILVDRDSGGAFTAPFAGTAGGYPGVPVVAGRRAHPPLYATSPRKFHGFMSRVLFILAMLAWPCSLAANFRIVSWIPEQCRTDLFPRIEYLSETPAP